MNNNESRENIRQSVRPSFWEIYAAVAEQIELDCFSPDEMPLAEDICKIIAEIWQLSPTGEMKLEGEAKPIKLVQDIYAYVKNDNVRYVIENLRSVDYPITSKKAWLRTAIYTSVFETNAGVENQVRTDFCPA